jgi:hypothetical protein
MVRSLSNLYYHEFSSHCNPSILYIRRCYSCKPRHICKHHRRSLSAPPKPFFHTFPARQYVIDLSDDELLDQVRFQLSTFLAARYGSSPLSTRGLSTSSYARLSITVDIEMTAPILKVTCPSHTVEISLGPRVPLSQSDKRPLSHFARVSLTNQDSFLDQDFVLSIQAAKLDYPRCFAETLPNAQTIALSLTLVPRFELPPIPSQEYIFVIDRSGSMKGAKMDSAKRALIVLLKSLPIPGTSFNILSFGSSSLSMWEKSKNYAQDTLDDAVRISDVYVYGSF